MLLKCSAVVIADKYHHKGGDTMSLYLLDMDKLAIDLRKESVLKHFNKQDRIKIGNMLLERLIPESLISIKHNIIDTHIYYYYL